MFKNLRAEMARCQVTQKQLAKVIGITEWTLIRKINGHKRN